MEPSLHNVNKKHRESESRHLIRHQKKIEIRGFEAIDQKQQKLRLRSFNVMRQKLQP